MFQTDLLLYWRTVIDTNLNSLFNVTKQVIDGMFERSWGRIINISSVNGEKGQFGQSNYSAAKAGLQGLTKTLALELARYQVTVNAVAPGFVASAMTAGVAERVGLTTYECAYQSAGRTPESWIGPDLVTVIDDQSGGVGQDMPRAAR